MRARLAALLLQASGHVGALGPVLAAATARAADLLTAAAERIAPLVECPGCGGAVPSLDLEVVGVCGECAEREAVAPLVGVTLPDAYADARINVPPARSAKLN
jgi:hypothetical protein